MSATAELEQLQKKRTELENEWTSLEQKEQMMKENARKLVEQVSALLEEKKAALEKLELALKDLEKKLVELQENRRPSSSSNEPITIVEKKAEAPEQAIVAYWNAEKVGSGLSFFLSLVPH